MGLGKEGGKAVIKRAYIRFTTKRTGVSTRHPATPSSCASGLVSTIGRLVGKTNEVGRLMRLQIATSPLENVDLPIVCLIL